MAEYNRDETPMTRGAQWPDGSPVSNWSQAVAAMVLQRAARAGGAAAARAAAGAFDADHHLATAA